MRFLGAVLFLISTMASAKPVVIGSKKFTESYVLAEIAKQSLGEAGISVEFRPGMGGTIIVWEALRSGQIDIYPEYTGTLAEEILKNADISPEMMQAELAQNGIGMSPELGFNNTWALAMRREAAQRLSIRTISDLRTHPELKYGLTHEFLDRRDGWPALVRRYGLRTGNVQGIDHGLGYEALRTGSIDKVSGTLDEARMIRLNAEAERTKNYARAAALYFGDASDTAESFSHKLLRWTERHLELAGFSLLLSVLIGIPLGIIASRPGFLSQIILGLTSAIQTIPSLALLALLVPLPFFGISVRTAIAALFLYGLLPIVRNTATGLQDIAPSIRESATALGLTSGARLRRIYLPIGSRTILAGIKTSAVINIGTATLAALIGAGGLGEPIISGLNLNDHVTILEGAIPAALLALLVQFFFDLLDRVLIPRGLRL
ncbi:MAG: glycine/betaine ABC transporter substrate-binding protein [Verrucomicrobia bacterium]|nr:MAG: glycine/betaine ABC transporter substrate-binding protein [Verrucomicrobiota bacterium]